MKFQESNLKGLFVIEPNIYEDSRGYFLESFNKKQFDANIGLKINFCQDNQSKSKINVLRGLHFRNPPYAQGKLVRVLNFIFIE